MIGYDVDVAEGVKGDSPWQVRSLVRERPLTLLSRLTRSDLSLSSGGYKECLLSRAIPSLLLSISKLDYT